MFVPSFAFRCANTMLALAASLKSTSGVSTPGLYVVFTYCPASQCPNDECQYGYAPAAYPALELYPFRYVQSVAECVSYGRVELGHCVPTVVSSAATAHVVHSTL